MALFAVKMENHRGVKPVTPTRTASVFFVACKQLCGLHTSSIIAGAILILIKTTKGEIMTVTVHCSGIMCENTYEFEIPDWTGDYDTEGGAYCPECNQQERWFGTVCPGCVEGYPDCALSKSFAYSERTITSDQLRGIRSGVCPFRTGGTFGVSREGGITSIDLSERAPVGNGDAIAGDIERYCKEYS